MKKILFPIIAILALTPIAAFALHTIHVYYGETDSIAVPGEELRINVKLGSDTTAKIDFIHMPLSSNDTYISSRNGGVFLAPFTTWDDTSFRPPDINQPYAGWTSQSILAFAYVTDPPPDYSYMNPLNSPIIAYYQMQVQNNPSLVGQTATILQPGHNYLNGDIEIGDTTDVLLYPTQEHFYPVTFRTYATGTGTGLMGNQQNHIDSHYCGGPGGFRLQDITRRVDNNPHGHNGQMPSDQAIYTYKYHSGSIGDTIRNPTNTWQDSIYWPAVDAQVYAGQFYDYLLSEFQRNSWDSSGTSMISVINDATHVNNSYWTNDGDRVIYGTSDIYHRPDAGCLEVVAHEFSHGITQNESHLLAENEAGAIDESFSNIMGVTARYVITGRPGQIDWTMGRNGFRSLIDSVLYSLSDPHGNNTLVKYKRPDYYHDATDWYNGSNNDEFVHTNSGVIDKMFYFLSVGGTSSHNQVQVAGIGIENAMKVLYQTNINKWQVSDSTFLFSRWGCIAVAESISGGGQDWAVRVAKAFNAVGVCDSCQYVPGDANNDGAASGQDIQYLVAYFKGFQSATYLCNLAYRSPHTFTNFYAPADYNGNCIVNGMDVTYGVGYFKGQHPSILWCPHFTPEAP